MEHATDFQSTPLLVDAEDIRSPLRSPGVRPPPLISNPQMSVYIADAGSKARWLLRRASSVNLSRFIWQLRRLGYCFVPQLLRTHLYDDRIPPIPGHATAWLNGIRGIAGLGVYMWHYVFAFTDAFTVAWGVDEKHMHILSLPIVRFFFMGLPMIGIFFIGGGYVLSLRALQSMKKAEYGTLMDKLSGSLFRRFFRLYFTAATAMIISGTMAYIGFFEPLRPYIENKRQYFPGLWAEEQIPKFDSFWAQVGFFFHELDELGNLWRWARFYPLHDHHLWTIRIEYRSGIILFLGLFAFAKCRDWVRLIFMFAVSCWMFWWDRSEVMAFYHGACIAQFDVIRQGWAEKANELPSSSSVRTGNFLSEKAAANGGPITPYGNSLLKLDSYAQLPALVSTTTSDVALELWQRFDIMRASRPQAFQWLAKTLWLTTLLFSMFCMSSPMTGVETAYGYGWIFQYIPSWYSHTNRFVPQIGSPLFMLCLTLLTPQSYIHRFLATQPIQYLGKHMFSIYLCHGPVLHLFGYMTPWAIWWLIQGTGLGGLDPYTGEVLVSSQHFSMGFWMIGMVLGWWINLAFILWAADVFTREIEYRIVYLIKIIEKLCYQ